MLDLPAARLNVQGTTARKGVPKEAPGCANVQERFSRCKTKSSFQPRSTTAGREIPRRLRARPQRHAWLLVLQPFIPTRPPTHLDRF